MAGSWVDRRLQLQTYFDRTAVDAWARLTSDAPVGSIRATVREGRRRMRETLLGWLPLDLRARRLLDAGCGTGALTVEAARRGASVTAVDISPTLIALARERLPTEGFAVAPEFRVGDMADPALGEFDHVVSMDSLIHYRIEDVLPVLGALAARTRGSIVFTFAPRTPALAVMHAVGRLFPRGNRAPAIEPIVPALLRRRLAQELPGWSLGRTERIACGFYTSEAVELLRR